MGIFDFFKRKAEPKNVISSTRMMPTIKADADLFITYSEIFRKEMATITALSKKEIKDIYAFIANGEGGFLNQSHYHHIIFDRYFKDREWFWPEYEELKNVYVKPEDRPVTWEKFKPWLPIEEIKLEDALEMITIPEIKELLKRIGVSFEPKTNKKTLIALALKQPLLFESLANFPAWTRVSSDYVLRRRSKIYSTLMLTLNFRAITLYDRKRQLKLGCTKAKWRYSSSCGKGQGSYPGHMEANEKTYDLSRGLNINGQYVYPGTLINCHCMELAIIRGKTGVE